MSAYVKHCAKLEGKSHARVMHKPMFVTSRDGLVSLSNLSFESSSVSSVIPSAC